MKPSKDSLDDASDGIEEYESEDLSQTDEDIAELVYKYPKSNRVLVAAILIFMGAGAYVCGVVLAQFPIKELPYILCVEFYNITLIMPAQSFPKVWHLLESLQLSESANINKAISGAGMAAYSAAVLWLYIIWVEGIGIMIARIYNYRNPDISSAFKLYLMPALLGTLYFLVKGIIEMLSS